VNAIEQSARRIYSVKEFTVGLAGWFARKRFFTNIAVAGEISDLHEFGNGHLGFKLKEEQAVLECVAWRDRKRDFPELKNGIAVVAAGSITVRQDRSCYQLVVERIEPTGLGALFLTYERLKEKFKKEGLFDAQRKRAVPELPRRVALISARGKAMEDFIETVKRRASFVEIEFIETQVQGQGAEIEIADALDRASRRDVDVIVLTRGGGSYEDLFPFNLEPVIRAIVRARRPVLTAIGHSGDHHLADDAADMPFGTPSLAAEYIVRGWMLATRRLRETEQSLARAARNIVVQAAQRLHEILGMRLRHGSLTFLAKKQAALTEWEHRLERRDPQRTFVAERRERLIRFGARLDTSAVRFFSDAARRLERGATRLDALNPLAPLARGYAIVTKNGVAIRDAALLRSGDLIEVRFERGGAGARVETVKADA
jgi:exodeoxyribonuclease VII large subunit